jgi:hypothetical protein
MGWDREKERKAGKALGIGGSIYGVVFMVIWCGIAASMGAWFMLIFGVPMLGFMVYRLIVILKKSKAPKEKDPWEQTQSTRTPYETNESRRDGYCPYCGRTLEEDFSFCPGCGRRL